LFLLGFATNRGALLTRDLCDDQCDHLTVRSGEDGRFRVKLAPGKYKLTPMAPNPGAPPHAPGPQAVTVEPGKYAHVTIKYDSGIR